MPNRRFRILICLIIATSTVFAALASASADEPPDYHGQVSIEDVWVTPAKEGDRSILRLRIKNESQGHIHLLGATTPFAEDAQIVGRISDHETARLDSIGIRPEDDLDLTTGHLWIELAPLTREIRRGESIPVELVFVRRSIRAQAHVHAADG